MSSDVKTGFISSCSFVRARARRTENHNGVSFFLRERAGTCLFRTSRAFFLPLVAAGTAEDFYFFPDVAFWEDFTISPSTRALRQENRQYSRKPQVRRICWSGIRNVAVFAGKQFKSVWKGLGKLRARFSSKFFIFLRSHQAHRHQQFVDWDNLAGRKSKIDAQASTHLLQEHQSYKLEFSADNFGNFKIHAPGRASQPWFWANNWLFSGRCDYNTAMDVPQRISAH